jgi:hypothetical protein
VDVQQSLMLMLLTAVTTSQHTLRDIAARGR